MRHVEHSKIYPARAEAYISVDIEASGPIPGIYSMLALGACVVDKPTKEFYLELQPISEKFVPEAMQVTGFSIDQLYTIGKTPTEAMEQFGEWIINNSDDRQPVFVGFNASFDWSFINWYFHNFLGKNPFGIGGIDIKAYYMGLIGCKWNETSSSRLIPEFQPVKKQTHNALDDARAQAEIFARLLATDLRE